MLRISNIKIRKNLSNQEILEIALKKYKIHKQDILEWYISKQSIDARKKDDVQYIYSIDLEVKNEKTFFKSFGRFKTKPN